MAFVSLNQLLPKAREERYAIPQFNINGYLWAEAILEVAEKQQKPIIIGVTDKNVERLGGYNFIREMIFQMIDKWGIGVPIVLHLDHGKSIESCKKAIDAGFSSVMFDGSHLPLNENIKLTKEIVEYASEENVSVEGEIGGIGGSEDGVTSNILHADPVDCVKFHKETGVDALAAALGSVHGQYKGEPDLKFEVIQTIKESINVPLVLHGASGIPEDQLQKAIGLGHAKINFNTELNQCWAQATRKLLQEQPDLYDPKVVLGEQKKALKVIATNKIDLLYNR